MTNIDNYFSNNFFCCLQLKLEKKEKKKKRGWSNVINNVIALNIVKVTTVLRGDQENLPPRLKLVNV